MYSIFSMRTRKRAYLEEGEPPPKKLVTEADGLIKTLAETQLRTDIRLAEQLNQRKEFTSSETFTNITAYISGETDLHHFKLAVDKISELDNFKSKGLSDRDIELYNDYISLGSDFWQKYKDVNKDVLQQHLQEVFQIVSEADNASDGEPPVATSRHMEDYLNALKPCSTETKLLKFATKNPRKNNDLPNAIDVLPNLERQFTKDLEEFSACDIKKIRKKARSLGNKIDALSHVDTSFAVNEAKSSNVDRNTLWDMRDKPADLVKKNAIIDKDKVYTCKPQNWYTVRDGKIIKLNNNSEPTHETSNVDKQLKLTLEEIRKIPKFSSYEQGTPSKTLFLKNLGKINEGCLKTLLSEAQLGLYSIKVMSGKMRGQAFIEFGGEDQAKEALEILNGVLVGEKPIIAQFGKKKIV